VAYIKANFGIVYKLRFFIPGISNLSRIQDLCHLFQEFRITPTYMKAVDWNIVIVAMTGTEIQDMLALKHLEPGR
jgi:hypothetical protein